MAKAPQHTTDTTQKPGATKIEQSDLQNPTGAVQHEKKFRTPYGVLDREALDFSSSPSLTQQHMAADCDIHNILNRYEDLGIPYNLNSPALGGTYEDVSDVGDYKTAMEIVQNAQAAFDALPAKVRDRFANSPEAYLSFLNDPENADEALRMGLVEKRPDADPSGSQAPKKGAGVTEGTPDGTPAPKSNP